ncbi:unnamed protein product [Ilex paraguariensis]|uniref:Coiled-coil domain-containing protein 22 homolog n=1 Tax=Ilex paraguariensis TaxID=185542 RepID=A0ABC8RKY3_9AQUA
MEESREVLLSWLANSGVEIPLGVSSIEHLTPATLVSICSQSLRLIDNTSSFPTSLPDSMADQFKICTDIAAAVKNLGYIGDMSFHKFLYPSEEDVYKLVRFLVERLSESSEAGKSAELKTLDTRILPEKKEFRNTSEDRFLQLRNEEIITSLKDLRLNGEMPESLIAKPEAIIVTDESNVSDMIPLKIQEVAPAEACGTGIQDSSKDSTTVLENAHGWIDGISDSRFNASENEETAAHKDSKHVEQNEQKQTSCQEHSSEIKKLQSQEKVLLEELNAKSLELAWLEEEHELLKAAVEMAFDNQHPIDFYIVQLNEQIDAKRHNLVQLESQWDAFRESLEEKKRSLEEALYATKPEAQQKLQKLKEIDLETKSILSEIKRREEEVPKLVKDLDKQPKLPSRGSYIQKIKEITKNSRKQDGDIERILKETRELQLESNSIQERLHRTYAVVDETVFREAKKDPVGRQAYRLLTSIHESFEQISEKILATDRTSREVADLEAKLASMASRSLNIDKLQADLDSIREENESLQQGLSNS